MSNSFPGIIAAEKCQSKIGRLGYVNITDPLLVGRTGLSASESVLCGVRIVLEFILRIQ